MIVRLSAFLMRFAKPEVFPTINNGIRKFLQGGLNLEVMIAWRYGILS